MAYLYHVTTDSGLNEICAAGALKSWESRGFTPEECIESNRWSQSHRNDATGYYAHVARTESTEAAQRLQRRKMVEMAMNVYEGVFFTTRTAALTLLNRKVNDERICVLRVPLSCIPKGSIELDMMGHQSSHLRGDCIHAGIEAEAQMTGPDAHDMIGSDVKVTCDIEADWITVLSREEVAALPARDQL